MISVDATALLICALVFALVLVLKNLFFEPLAQTMEKREEQIARAATAWDDAQKTIEGARNDVASAVQSTRNEGYRELDRARSEAQTEARSDLDDQRSTAQKQIDKARKRLSDETDKAILTLESEAEALAAQIASRILGRDIA